MKRRGLLSFSIVLTVFLMIQGWLVYKQFIRVPAMKTDHAFLTGQSVTVGTPVSGIVKSVNVTEGKHVEKGQPLFLISQQSPMEPNGDKPIAVVAQQAGTVYDVQVTANSFVQASQVLAHIVDSSPEGLYVEASMALQPEQLAELSPSRYATVQAALLNNGNPMSAVITSVGIYDGSTGTVDLRLRLVNSAVVLNGETILKLPVEVTILTKQEEKIAVESGE